MQAPVRFTNGRTPKNAMKKHILLVLLQLGIATFYQMCMTSLNEKRNHTLFVKNNNIELKQTANKMCLITEMT